MSILFVLIPLGLALLGLAIWGFIWAVNNDQFEDLDQAAHSILFDDDLSDFGAVDASDAARRQPREAIVESGDAAGELEGTSL